MRDRQRVTRRPDAVDRGSGRLLQHLNPWQGPLLAHVRRVHLTFLVQHWLGNEGFPRRYVDYLPTDGFTTLRYGRVVTVDDPWGFGNSLEWATTCPPPRHNFTELPRIRSERPAFELHYPHLVERYRAEAHVGRKPSPYELAARGVGQEEQPNQDPRSR